MGNFDDLTPRRQLQRALDDKRIERDGAETKNKPYRYPMFGVSPTLFAARCTADPEISGVFAISALRRAEKCSDNNRVR